MGLLAQTNIFYRLFAIRRGDRVGRPLCAEGPRSGIVNLSLKARSAI